MTAESACALFNICLNLFLEQPSDDIGRIVALDEAHKYMTESAECQTLTESLLSTIRLQRHLGARIVIATQEPTISPKLLDLCSVSLVHRFTSPNWLASLKRHLAAASLGHTRVDEAEEVSSCDNNADGQIELLDRIVSLRQGEALMFCPSAIIGISKPKKAETVDGLTNGLAKCHLAQHDAAENPTSDACLGNGLIHLSQGIMKLRIRERITEDGGKSVMAG